MFTRFFAGLFTFAIAVSIGAAAVIASQGAAQKLPAPAAPAAIHAGPDAVEVIRLDPVVVTASRAWFEAARSGKLDETNIARENARSATRKG